VVKPFPTYISKLYGEEEEEGITYVKLMILEETCSQLEKSNCATAAIQVVDLSGKG
jgi:hypothetical protein